MKKWFVYEIIIITLLCLSTTASSQESYVFDRMWPALNLSWNFLIPNGIAFDKSGNLYVADSKTNRLVKLTQDGFYITWWGGEGDEDGKLNKPLGVAVDSAGNVYVTEQGNNRIQKFDSEGNHLTAWGSECVLETGDGCVDPDDDGPLEVGDGQFNVPNGIAVDSGDNVYVADVYNNRIQKFNSNGDYLLTFEGDFSEPHDVAIDSRNTVYVADSSNSRVLLYTLDGKYLDRLPSCTNDQELFSFPSHIAIDGGDNVYIAEQYSDNIQKLDSDGKCIIDWWGGEDAIGETFSKLNSMAIDKSGYVYVTDVDSIQKFSAEGDFIIRWSNGGDENGKFNFPQGVALDTEGFVYVADTENHRVQKFTPDGQYELQWGEQDSDDEHFRFGHIDGIATDAYNNVFVVDSSKRCIKKFTSEGEFRCKWGEYGSEGGEFKNPSAIAIDTSGNVFVTDVNPDTTRIQKFKPTPDGNHCTDGSGYELDAMWGKYGYESDPDPDEFRSPYGIALDDQGNVYITDANFNPRILKYRPTPDGTGGINESGYEYAAEWGGLGTGPGEFAIPWGLAVDTENSVYVTDVFNPRIQKFSQTPDGTGGIDDSGYDFVTEWGSTGSWAGQFEEPRGIAVSANGSRVYVSDYGTNRIQVFSKYESLTRPKAIIVAGGGPYEGNSLWDATQTTANFAYQILINRGFTKEDIYYLTSDTDVDMDGNDEFREEEDVRFSDDVYAIPTNESLQQAITDAVNDNAENLVLYLTDHGNDLNGGTFYLNEHHEPLVAPDLASWLNALEEEGKIPGKIVVIYDGCQSESFIDDLRGEDRIIVTSARQYERAKFLNQGIISFSNFFWTNVFNRFSVEKAYNKATQAINFYFSNQNPQLSGSADDVYIEILQGDRGVPVVGDAPTIDPDTIEITVNSNTSVDLCAYVGPDPDGIARVWGEVLPPNSNLGLVSEPLIDQLDTIELILPPGEECYRATFENIEDSGFFQVAIYAMDGRGNISEPALNTISFNDKAIRKAIIVGGYEGSADGHIVETNVGLAHNALTSQGYHADDICCQTIYNIPGSEDEPTLPTMNTFQECINNFYQIDVEEGFLDLVIYLTGEGNPETFTLNESNQLLHASDLAVLLNNLQEDIPSKITFIYDAHFSGSFIPILLPPPGKERILVTSSGENEEAYFNEEGDISFSHFFWGQASIGATLYDAFAYGKNAISYFSHREEISFSCYIQKGPLLDANGVTPANEAVDYDIARGRTIGMGQVFADEVPPQIGSVSLEETGDGILISVGNIQPPDNIQRVWAEIKPLRYCPENPGVDAGTLAEEVLGPVEGGGYEVLYTGPLEAFKVSVYAMDEDQTISLPKETRFYQVEGGDIYEDPDGDNVPDDEDSQANVIVVNHATPQPHNFHVPGDKDWVKFYALTTFINPDTGVEEKYTYRIKAGNLGGNCKPVIELYREDDTDNPLAIADTIAGNSVVLERELDEWGDGIYYVKLFHNPQEPYNSGNTDYELQVDNEDAGGLSVLITGRVQDRRSGGGIDGAFISTNGGASAISVGGRYDLYQKPGTWSLRATANGYQSFGTSITVNTGGGIIPLDISLPSRPTSSKVDCSEDLDCDDGLFCNGSESCVEGTCLEGSNPCLPLTCNEESDTCVICSADEECDDGVFCNGVETCLDGECRDGADPCPEGVGCDEESDGCNMPSVLITPGSLMQSRWIPFPVFLRVQGTDTNFGASSEVTFSPNSIMALPMVSNHETMFCLGLLMPTWITGPTGDSITITITTGLEELSGTIVVDLFSFIPDQAKDPL